MKKKIVISVVCSIILMVFFYNYQSFFLFQIDKFILSNTEMIEKYFNIGLNEKIEIIQFDIYYALYGDSPKYWYRKDMEQMKRNVCFVLILMIVGAFILVSCGYSSNKNTEDYLYKINSIIKDMDFYTAKADDNKIILYNIEQEIIKEIPFEDYNGNIKFLYARKEESAIYFVISGSVDDEQGIMFVNDNSDGFLDGIKTINRIGGNSYQYSTN